MEPFFPTIEKVRYAGPDSDNPFAYRHYDKDKQVLGQTMAAHLRFAVCYWHTFCWQGNDPFGAMSLSLLKFVGQASLVDDAMLPS